MVQPKGSLFSVLLLSTVLAAASMACSNATSTPDASNEPADDQPEEQDLTTGATKLASRLQSPDGLTTLGDNVYWSTTYGYATQEEAQYNHDIWIKSGSGRAKRLYKGLYGASWGQVVTKNGVYEINEGYASVIRYPLDGSKPDGESLVHAIYGNDEMPEVGVVKLAADDNGFVVGTRTADGDGSPGDITAYTPAGKSATKLGTVGGAASALVLAGDTVLVGTSAGDVLAGARSGAGSLKKIASGKGEVQAIAMSGKDTFFATKEGVYVLRDGKSAPDQLVAEGALDLLVVRDTLLYSVWGKGVSSIPLSSGAGATGVSVFKTKSPTALLFQAGASAAAPGQLFVTDASLGACKDTDEGQACAWDGAVFRLKF